MSRTSPGVTSEVIGVWVVSTRRRRLAADEPERPVPDQGAREQPGLAEDLEAVADPEHRTAPAGEARTPSITGANRAIAPVRR